MTIEDPSGRPKKPDRDDKERKPFSSFVDKERVDNFFEYARTHTQEMVAYALLILGIFLLFVYPVLGQALIGIVFAVYFGSDIINYISNYEHYQKVLGPPRTLVLIGTLVGLFVMAPLIFIAAGFTMALKHLLVAGENRGPKQ